MTKPSEPMGFCDERLVPLREMSVPVWDAGLVHGTLISEQLRTFGAKPFLLDRHFDRWVRGLHLLGIASACDYPTLCHRIDTLIEVNSALLPAHAEQGICFFASPGDQFSFVWDTQSESRHPSSRFFAHSYPLKPEGWLNNYQDGVSLITTSIREVPDQCWPKSVKIRSRLHYYLAQRQSTDQQPGSFPILLNDHGQIADSAIGSIVGYQKEEGIIVRPASQRYGSTTVRFLLDLASELDIPISDREFTIGEALRFDEMFLVSTPWCMFPIASIDQRPIGEPQTPRNVRFGMFRRLLEAWSDVVGVPIFPCGDCPSDL